MTREGAIDILKNTIVRFGRTNGKTAYAEALQMAIKALEEPQLIPYDERLPEDDTVVFVCGRKGGVYSAWKLNNKNHHYEPIAWCEKPEPYRKEGKSDESD